MRQVCTLVWKDIHIHWRTISSLMLVLPIGVQVMLRMQQAGSRTGGSQSAGRAAMLIVTLLVPVAVAVASWLIERERSRETFAWLRTLPVSDAHIVASKFISCLVFYLIGGAAWAAFFRGSGLDLTAYQFVSVWFGSLVVAGFALLSQLLLTGRMANASPALLMLLVAWFAVRPVEQSGPAIQQVRRLWGDPRFHAWLWIGCVVLQGVFAWLSYLRFHSQETDELIE